MPRPVPSGEESRRCPLRRPVLSRRRRVCVRERWRLGAAGGVRRGDAVRRLPRRDASETRRRIRRRSIAPWIDRQPAGAATRRTGPDATDRRIRRELIRVTNAPDLAKQGWRPNAVEVSGSGLRPEGVLVYDERSQGRVAGPTAKVSQPRQIGRTLTSHEANTRSPGVRLVV